MATCEVCGVQLSKPHYKRCRVHRIAHKERLRVVRRSTDFPPPTPQPTPCILWQGGLSTRGYGQRHIPGRGQTSVVRWLMETALGRRLERGEVVVVFREAT